MRTVWWVFIAIVAIASILLPVQVGANAESSVVQQDAAKIMRSEEMVDLKTADNSSSRLKGAVTSGKKTIMRAIAARVKTIKTVLTQKNILKKVLWGAGTWGDHYLRRASTIGGVIVSCCIGRDILKAISGRVKVNLQDKNNGEEDIKEEKEEAADDECKVLIERQKKINDELLCSVSQKDLADLEWNLNKAIDRGDKEYARSIVNNKHKKTALRYLLTYDWTRNVLGKLACHISDNNNSAWEMVSLLLSVVDKPEREPKADSSFVLCPDDDWLSVITKMMEKSHGRVDLVCMILEKSCYGFKVYQQILNEALKYEHCCESVSFLLDHIRNRKDAGVGRYKAHINRILLDPVRDCNGWGFCSGDENMKEVKRNKLLRILLERNEGAPIVGAKGETLLDSVVKSGNIPVTQLLIMLGEKMGPNLMVEGGALDHNCLDKLGDYAPYLVGELCKNWRRLEIDPNSALRAIFCSSRGIDNRKELEKIIRDCVLEGGEIEPKEVQVYAINNVAGGAAIYPKDYMWQFLGNAQKQKIKLLCSKGLECKLPKALVGVIEQFYVQDNNFVKRLEEGGKDQVRLLTGYMNARRKELRNARQHIRPVSITMEEQNARKLRLRLLREWEELELDNARNYESVGRVCVQANIQRRKWLQEYRATESDAHKKAYKDFIIMISRFDKVHDNTLGVLEAIANFPDEEGYGMEDQERITGALRKGARLDLGVDGFFRGWSPYTHVWPDSMMKRACSRFFEQPSFARDCSAEVSRLGLPMVLSGLPTDEEIKERAGLFTPAR